MENQGMGSWADDIPTLPDEQEENPDNWKFLVLITVVVLVIILIAIINKKAHGNQRLQGEYKEEAQSKSMGSSYRVYTGAG